MAAVPQPFGGDMTLYSATQVPHILKVMAALTLGIPEHQMRVVAPAVGGGFGSKLDVYAEELLCVALARKHGVPVRWDEERSENTVGHHPRPRPDPAHRAGRRRRRQAHRGARPPARRHGRLPAARHARHPASSGRSCTPACTTSRTPTTSAAPACSPRSRPPTPTAAPAVPRPPTPSSGRWTRWPTRWASTRWSCASATSSSKEQFPYTAFTGLAYDSGDHLKAADTGRRAWPTTTGVRARQQATERAGRHQAARHRRQASYFEMCGLAPSRVLASLNYSAGGWEAATVRMLPTNKVQVVTGTAPHGQGHETAWSMIVADKLGVSPDDVDVLHSDTAIAPLGLDTYGSRSLPVGGVAIAMACDKVIDKAKKIAAHQLEAQRGRPRVRRRRVHGEGLARSHDAARRHRVRGVHRPQPARRPRAQPRGPGHLRPAELLVAVRHAHLRGRGRHRDRRRSTCCSTWPSTTAATR